MKHGTNIIPTHATLSLSWTVWR